ncbi:MAG: DUF624 domain-containing protein, partial [Anaerolineae bacterium]
WEVLMRQTLSVIFSSLKDFYEELFLFVIINLLCVLLSIPLVTLAPALAGVYYVTNHLAHGRYRTEWRDFFVGFRRYFAKSWQVLLADLFLLLLIVSNISFYTSMPNQILRLVSILWWYLLAFWLGLQIYLFPLLMEQEDKRLLLIFRNAIVLTLRHPFFTIAFLLVILLLLVISLALVAPIVVLLISLVAFLSNRALLTLIGKYPEKAGS